MAKAPRLTSPKGIGKYVWLNKPSTKFKPEGEYTVSLAIDPENAAAFTAEIDKLMEEAFAAAVADPANKKIAKKLGKGYPYKMEIDDEGEETGRIEFKFKKAASYKDKKTDEVVHTVVGFFDIKGKKIVDPPKVFSGSILKVNCNVSPRVVQSTLYITLYINGVQVLQLSSGSSPFGDESAGFEEEPGKELDDAPEGGEGGEGANKGDF